MNKPIVAATLLIGGSGVVNAWLSHKPVTPVIIGSYVFMLILSLADLFGGEISRLMSALALLAAGYVVLTEIPWTTILGLVKGKPTGGISGGGVAHTPYPEHQH
jgi:hypothetical protein